MIPTNLTYSRRAITALGLLLFIYVDGIAQWTEANTGLNGGQTWNLKAIDGYLFAGTFGGVFRSSDKGKTWTAFNDGLADVGVNDIVYCGGYVFLACNGTGEVYVAEPDATMWTKSARGLMESTITGLAIVDETVFALDNFSRVFKTIDYGLNWAPVDAPHVNKLAIGSGNDVLYLATFEGIYASYDAGETWQPRNTGLPNLFVPSLAIADNSLLAWSSPGVHFSSNGGTSWSSTPIDSDYIGLARSGSLLLAGTRSTAYRSTNGGATWHSIPSLRGFADAVFPDENTIVASNEYGLFRSTDDGLTWVASMEGLTNANVTAFAELDDRLVVSTGTGVFRSDTHGTNWQRCPGLPWPHRAIVTAFKGTLIVSQEGELYVSDNDGTSWTFIGHFNFTRFASTDNMVIAAGVNGVFTSTDRGRSWIKRSDLQYVTSLIVAKGKIFAGTFDKGILSSSDNGTTWTPANTGLPSTYMGTLYHHDGTLYAGVVNSGIYTSANGTTWQRADAGIGAENHVNGFAAMGDNVFAGGNTSVFVTEDKGNNWVSIGEGLPPFSISNDIQALTIYRGKLFSGKYGTGVWYYTPCANPLRPEFFIQQMAGTTVLVSAALAGNQWYRNGVAIPGASGNSYTPITNGIYTVVVSVDGCRSQPSDGKYIDVGSPDDNDPPVLVMPNVFTPNGDDRNQRLVPERYANISGASFQIINRYGREVYTGNNLANGWDGEGCGEGLYFYNISFTGTNGEKGSAKGWVHLIR